MNHVATQDLQFPEREIAGLWPHKNFEDMIHTNIQSSAREQDRSHSGHLVIDVRSKEEYDQGHVPGSRHIPLSSIMMHLEELANESQEIILVCASGNRSGMACMMLQREGISCQNGGAWQNMLPAN